MMASKRLVLKTSGMISPSILSFLCVVLDLDELIPENTIQCVFTFSESLLTLSHFRREHHM